jgi:2-methylcitrate dehydratase
MNDGRTYERRVDTPRGSPKNPLEHEEIQAKFFNLAIRMMTEERASEIIGIVSRLEKMDNVADLMNSLSITSKLAD